MQIVLDGWLGLGHRQPPRKATLFAPKGSVSRVAGSEDYLRIRRRIVDVASSLGPDEPTVVVPATPEWTVHDVLAHVIGAATDVISGRIDGVATDPWTALQVEARRNVPVDEMLAEWDDSTPRLVSLIDSAGDLMDPRLFLDLWTHEQDIRGALARPGGRDDPIVADFAPGTAAGFVKRSAAAGLEPLSVEVMGIPRRPTPQRAVSVRVDPFELIRAVVGRRSRAQIGRWDWSGTDDTDSYAEALVVFTLADRDVVDAH